MIDNTMTAPRHRRKLCPDLSRRGFVAAAAELGVVAMGVLASIPATQAATTEQIVNDRHSGLAIHGFDPVAYFIGGTAALGNDAFEHTFGGVAWRFCNEGNLAAFIVDPELYIPQFGGYDPVAVARGVAVPGDPRLWLMSEERLYLFFAPEARGAFAGDAKRLSATADRKWPAVQLTLSP
jgi:YHS domain-containing protein